MARIIDGKAIARAIEAEVETSVRQLTGAGLPPHLVTIQVGQNAATEVYIKNQEVRFARLGIQLTHLALDGRASEETIRNHLRSLNENPTVTGIMVTLPLPPGIN